MTEAGKIIFRPFLMFKAYQKICSFLYLMLSYEGFFDIWSMCYILTRLPLSDSLIFTYFSESGILLHIDQHRIQGL